MSPSDQRASAASSESASAAAASQSSPAETPAADECVPLRPKELHVAAALLVVLHRAQKEGCGAVTSIKELLVSNDPRTSLFLQALPEDGELPSLKQLEISSATRDWLLSTFELCRSAECQPLELFTRRTLCSTHLRATHSVGSKEFAARQQRLQAIWASLAIGSAAESREDEVFEKLYDRVELLAQHDVAPKLRTLITVLLQETIQMLELDSRQLGACPVLMIAGSASSFTVCIDHMLPGVLDALLEHETEDLTSVDALLRMVLPLEGALDSYRDRATAAKKSPTDIVMLEAAVQGW
ncbi:g10047 [Coccomyxa viridis]|uniref:G10047 protein n=1 Tax=Coccomyxa viridis TaxID=1274662 RepID=A0ABP1G4B9_9CHLO